MDMKVPLGGPVIPIPMRERNLLLNVLIAKQILRRYTPPNDRAVGLAFDAWTRRSAWAWHSDPACGRGICFLIAELADSRSLYSNSIFTNLASLFLAR